MKQWDIAKTIQRILNQNGYPTYITGGAVRDRLMDQPSADVDLATAADPEVVQTLFVRTEPVGIAYGTVLVILQGIAVEVTTFRGSSIEDDLFRRDFTMNAMALDNDDNLIDPYGGQSAIRRKKIETVASPETTLTEDPLRMLRSFRFSVQLSFIESKAIVEWTEKNLHLLDRIAIERIVKEWEKVASVQWNKEKVNQLLCHVLIMKDSKLFPDEELSTALKVSGFPIKFLTIEQWWTFALFDRNHLDEALDRLKSLKLPNELIRQVKNTWQMIMIYYTEGFRWNDRHLYDAGKSVIHDACLMIQMIFGKKECFEYLDAYQSLPIQNKNELQLNGNHLMKHFPNIPKRNYTAIFSQMINAVLSQNVKNDRQQLLEWVKERESYEN